MGSTYQEYMAVLAVPNPHGASAIRHYAQGMLRGGVLLADEAENVTACTGSSRMTSAEPPGLRQLAQAATGTAAEARWDCCLAMRRVMRVMAAPFRWAYC